MLKSVRYCHAANAAMPDKFIQIREGANGQEWVDGVCFHADLCGISIRSGWLAARGQRFMGQQQRHDLYEQQRRREVMREGRDNSVLGPQPWWRTQNWCDANGTLFLCR